jgi:hypothetical protein
MICSELVYRCYTESGPQYDLIICGADTLAMRARSIPPMGVSAGTLATAAGQSHDATAIQAELDIFMAKYALAKHRGRSPANAKAGKPKNKRGSGLAATASDGTTALAVADFVTPRDLRDSPDLYKIGTLLA